VVDVVVFVHRTVVPTTIVTGSGVNEKLIIETAWVAVTPAPVTSPGPGATTKTATEIPRMATVTMVNQIRISPTHATSSTVSYGVTLRRRAARASYLDIRA